MHVCISPDACTRIFQFEVYNLLKFTFCSDCSERVRFFPVFFCNQLMYLCNNSWKSFQHINAEISMKHILKHLFNSKWRVKKKQQQHKIKKKIGTCKVYLNSLSLSLSLSLFLSENRSPNTNYINILIKLVKISFFL